jgi:hypothetical protein
VSVNPILWSDWAQHFVCMRPQRVSFHRVGEKVSQPQVYKATTMTAFNFYNIYQ